MRYLVTILCLDDKQKPPYLYSLDGFYFLEAEPSEITAELAEHIYEKWCLEIISRGNTHWETILFKQGFFNTFCENGKASFSYTIDTLFNGHSERIQILFHECNFNFCCTAKDLNYQVQDPAKYTTSPFEIIRKAAQKAYDSRAITDTT